MPLNILLGEQYKDASNYSARIWLHTRFSTNKYGFRLIMDRVAAPDHARVLELGTGTGLMWISNSEHLPPGWRIALSDFSAGMLKETRSNLARIGRPFNLMQIDEQALPFANHSVEIVMANYMLYHVADIPLALREIRRVLAPGAKCYAATLGRNYMKEFDDLVERFVGTSLRHGALSFGLENGYDYMREVFSAVELIRYPDQLGVTDAQALIEYLRSFSTSFPVSQPQLAALKDCFDSEIASHGAIRVTTDHEVLIATA